MDKVIEKYINYIETSFNRPITPYEFQDFQKSLKALAGDNVKLADAIVNQTIENGWQKIYKLKKENQPKKRINDMADAESDYYKKILKDKYDRRIKKLNEYCSKLYGIDYKSREVTLDKVIERHKIRRNSLYDNIL